MSNDELYYDELTNLAERIASGLQNRTKPLDQLNQALNQLASTNSIKGKAADSMKAYIGEVHLTLIQTLSLALTNYQMVLGKYVNSYLEVDGNHNFKLVREDLEEHQKQLGDHRSDFTDLASQLKAISDKAEGIVYLGGAGSSYLTNVAQKMDDMKKIANELMDKWNAYEQSEPGFNQIQDLLAQTRSLLKSTLKVPRGYDYKAGSFSGLMSKDFINALQTNASYAMDSKNQKEFSDDWTSINDDYNADQKRLAKAAEKKAKEEGIWGLILDTAQIVVGTAMVVTGVGAPFGAVLIVGGLNSAINHASMATTGKGFNLAGMVSDQVGKWYNNSAGKWLGNDGVGGFVNGFAKGAGSMASGMAQLNVYDLGKGAYTLATNSTAQQQMLKGLGNYWNQLRSGNMEVYGETVFNVVSLFVGGAEIKGAANVAKASEADSLLSKAGLFTKTLGKSGLNNAKNLAMMPGRALDNIGDIFEGKGPNYAFAHAGGNESVLNKIGREADALPKNDVQKNFNKVMSEANKTELDNIAGKSSGVNKDFVDNPFINGKGGKLKPDIQYKTSAPGTEHSYIYETNSAGDIVSVKADELHWKGDRKRLTNKRNTPDKLTDDEAGHLIADMFDGSPDLDNLVSQARDLNRGSGSEWKEMESQWREALTSDPPKNVTDVQIDVKYETGSHRPIGFDVQYTINGKDYFRDFPNVMKGGK